MVYEIGFLVVPLLLRILSKYVYGDGDGFDIGRIERYANVIIVLLKTNDLLQLPRNKDIRVIMIKMYRTR
jgi:hypothetical protein